MNTILLNLAGFSGDDEHDCTFVYNAMGMGKKEIRDNNPVIVAQKVAKI